MLYWDRSGFALWHKRLEEEKCHWPRHIGGEAVVLTHEQLRLLLQGIDITKMRFHKRLEYESLE